MMIRSCGPPVMSMLSQSTTNSTSLATRLLASNPGINYHNQPNVRSLFTSPALFYKTHKRHKRYPFFWLQDKYKAFYDENLTKQNEEFFQSFLKDKYSLAKGASPLRKAPWDTKSESFTEETQRIGLLAKKLGTMPHWTKTGRRVSTTCLLVSDNHVIKYHPPEEYAEIGRPVDRKRFAGLGCAIVGGDSKDPRQFTSEYNGLFKESGVMPKKKLTRFFITHNACLEPGTPLLATHFRPGMFVDIYGLSRDHGNVGLRMRFRLKLGQKTMGTTKQHNRIGSIGRGRKFAGPLKGKRMPGPLGHERRVVKGLRIRRIDAKHNLIFVNGVNVPGAPGAYVNIMDTRQHKKTLSALNITPPFPTATLEDTAKLDAELFDEEIHKLSDPSIVFEVSEEERKAAALAARKFGKAKTAQKLR